VVETTPVTTLGIDSYSFGRQGWSAAQILEHSAELGVQSVQFSGRGDYESLDPGYLRDLRQRADDLGLKIEAGTGCINRLSPLFRSAYGPADQQLDQMLDACVILGSPVLRCFLGGGPERTGEIPFLAHLDEVVRVIATALPKARDLGVTLALENHGIIDLLAREMRSLVERIGSEQVGVCVDLGNPTYAAEDPLLTVEVLAPYIVTSHVRDTRVWEAESGAAAQWVPLGEGNVGIEQVIATLRRLVPAATLNLEIITALPPRELAYFGSEFWRGYPDMPAPDFARFLALARRGHEDPYPQLLSPPRGTPVPEDLVEPLRRQQFEHVARSCEVLRGWTEAGR
jgi:3-oxoisoapionate decarboxylase